MAYGMGGISMGEVEGKELHYSDILLLPRRAAIDSRLDADITQKFGPYTFNLPVVPANMKTVINEELALWLSEKGYFYIHHRFGVDPVQFTTMMRQAGQIASISLGVNEDSMKQVHKLAEYDKPDYITVDIAHGHCDKMEKMVRHIKKYLPGSFLIAGNVCTYEGARFLQELEVDAIKVGIGSGKVCTTKLMTGFSRPQFSALLECAKVDIPIIADGGIEHNGDVAKALVAGATMVMAGGLLAGFDESPGKKIVHDDGRLTKEYFGSASEHNKGAKEFVEGRRIEIPYRGSIVDKLIEIKQSLRSSVSYAGGKDLSCFRDVDWVRQ
jgi:GMP reductase